MTPAQKTVTLSWIVVILALLAALSLVFPPTHPGISWEHFEDGSGIFHAGRVIVVKYCIPAEWALCYNDRGR